MHSSADLATARREATEALAQADACTCSNDDCDQKRSCFGLCLNALRALLAASPEPAPDAPNLPAAKDEEKEKELEAHINEIASREVFRYD